LDQELGLASFGIEVGEDLKGARRDRPGAEVAHRQGRVVEQVGAYFRPAARRVEPGSVQFVSVVKQAGFPSRPRTAYSPDSEPWCNAPCFPPRAGLLSTGARPRP